MNNVLVSILDLMLSKYHLLFFPLALLLLVLASLLLKHLLFIYGLLVVDVLISVCNVESPTELLVAI